MLSALLTPTIALLGAVIAWQQWRTNRNKLKLELFEKRYAFYEAAATFLGGIMASGNASHAATFQFLMATKGAKFIVGASIAEYLDKELYRKSIDLQALNSELDSLQGPERTRNIERQREIKNWFQDQYAVLDHKFDSLLSLKH